MPLPYYYPSSLIKLAKIKLRKLKLNKILLKVHEGEIDVYRKSKV